MLRYMVWHIRHNLVGVPVKDREGVYVLNVLKCNGVNFNECIFTQLRTLSTTSSRQPTPSTLIHRNRYTGERLKDFIKPVQFNSLARAEECVPKNVLKGGVLYDVQVGRVPRLWRALATFYMIAMK